MKACSHIKDFSELFCKENSSCLIHSVIASFGHLLSRRKPGVHKGIFLFYNPLEALKESVHILSVLFVPPSEVKMQYVLICILLAFP